MLDSQRIDFGSHAEITRDIGQNLMMHGSAVSRPIDIYIIGCTLRGCRHIGNICAQCMRERIDEPVTIAIARTIYHFFIIARALIYQQIQSHLPCCQNT